MDSQFDCVVLGSLSALFAGYGVWELTLAYKTTALKEWSERALPGTAGIIVGALFAAMIRQAIG
jgi:hypothetical protein